MERVNFLSYIPHQKLKEGAKLCLDNATCLVSVAKDIPNEYSSVAAFLSILAMEEVGKGIVLIKKYDEGSDLEEKEWKNLVKGPNAHKYKLGVVHTSLIDPYSVLKPHDLSPKMQDIKEFQYATQERAAQIDRFKQDQLYVDWKDGKWISPVYYNKERNKFIYKMEIPQSHVENAITAIRLLKTKLREFEEDLKKAKK
jgi:AbiV family abortive infection protein